jgi:hypothetical protein
LAIVAKEYLLLLHTLRANVALADISIFNVFIYVVHNSITKHIVGASKDVDMEHYADNVVKAHLGTILRILIVED